nr:MAG TPA: hypothetical protein [Caudoviricetes sp.]
MLYYATYCIIIIAHNFSLVNSILQHFFIFFKKAIALCNLM